MVDGQVTPSVRTAPQVMPTAVSTGQLLFFSSWVLDEVEPGVSSCPPSSAVVAETSTVKKSHPAALSLKKKKQEPDWDFYGFKIISAPEPGRS